MNKTELERELPKYKENQGYRKQVLDLARQLATNVHNSNEYSNSSSVGYETTDIRSDHTILRLCGGTLPKASQRKERKGSSLESGTCRKIMKWLHGK